MTWFDLNPSVRRQNQGSGVLDHKKGKKYEQSQEQGYGDKDGSRFSDDASDSWLTTYADMITLLLTFFVLMFSISDVSQEKFEEVKASLNGELLKKKQETTPFNAIEQIMKDAIEARGLENDVEVQRDPLGITISLASSSLYESGSANIKGGMKPILAEVARSIDQLDFPNFLVEVEGHTDDVPIRSGRYDSNWELSAHRATNVVRYLIEEGVAESKLKAAGFGDSRPLKPNRDQFGDPIPENQAANRRVVINIRRKA